MEKTKISDLIPDDKNFNKHNEAGQALIEKSLNKFGGGRSILIDKNNKIIAGNGTIEAAGNIGLEDVEIIESDGSKIIAVKRTDIDLDTPEGREMALADNATAKINITWADEILIEEVGSEKAEEWGVILIDEESKPTPTEKEDNDYKGKYPLAIILTAKDYKDWVNYKKSYQMKNDTAAFLKLISDNLIKL